jgi:hypothetical protein
MDAATSPKPPHKTAVRPPGSIAFIEFQLLLVPWDENFVALGAYLILC